MSIPMSSAPINMNKKIISCRNHNICHDTRGHLTFWVLSRISDMKRKKYFIKDGAALKCIIQRDLKYDLNPSKHLLVQIQQ